MKFTIGSTELKRVATVAAKATSQMRTLVMYAFGVAKINVNDGKLSVTSCSEMATTEIRADVDGSHPGTCYVDADILRRIASKTNGDVSMSIGANDELVIQDDTTKFQIKTHPMDSFPGFVDMADSSVFEPSFDMAEAVARVEYAVSANESRPNLNCILIDIREQDVSIVATNGYVLAKEKFGEGGIPQALVLPREIISVIRELQDCEMIEFNEKYAKIYSGDVITQCTRLTSLFPDYEKIIPSKHAFKQAVGKKDILNAVAKAGMLSKANSLTGESDVVLRMGAEGTTVSTRSEFHEFTSRVSLFSGTQGSELTVHLNKQYLEQTLKSCPSDEVEIRANSELEPVMILSGDNHSAVIMPVRP